MTNTLELQMTPAQQRLRRAEMEARVEYITQRRVHVADRLGLGVAAPGAVSAAELESLRQERTALESELEETLDALGVLRRCNVQRARRTGSVAGSQRDA